MSYLSIGQVAKKAQVNIQTIRYYERIELIPPPQRRESGYRQFTDEDLQRIRFILKAKELGFSLNEIRELLELRVDSQSNCKDIRHQTEAKISKIERKIDELERMREALLKLVKACRENTTTGECPILEALEG